MKKRFFLYSMLLFSLGALIPSAFSFGQVNSCPAPVAQAATNITSNSAVLDWTTVNPALLNQFTMRYRPVSLAGTPWTIGVPATKPLVLGGLQALTTYEWQIARICIDSNGASTTSAFSNLIVFTTLGGSNTCGVPGGLVSDSISSTAAKLTWNPVPGALSYNIRFRPANTLNWQNTTSIGTVKWLNNLLANTLYEWQVQTVCGTAAGNVNVSVFSSSQFFSTTGGNTGCPVPGNLFVNGITTSTATLHWGSTGAPQYRLRFRIAGTATWTVKSSTVNQKSISGLLPATAYEWQVRSLCPSPAGTITNSAWSPLHVFTTLPSGNCPAPGGVIADSIGNTSARISWNPVAGAGGYQVSYRPLNTNAWAFVFAGGNAKILQNLLANTAYECRVRSVCSNTSNANSPWSPSITFTTAPFIILHPNPASDRITIQANSGKELVSGFRLLDYTGNPVHENQFILQSGDNTFQLDISALKNGLYYYEFSNAEGLQRGKIMVRH
ncbi:MAG: fibronectin type III domain-containing protein [Bacteroidia bacterium]|nr:fibronectin type III domain-containing protein [Bacteroidia bacterium]